MTNSTTFHIIGLLSENSEVKSLSFCLMPSNVFTMFVHQMDVCVCACTVKLKECTHKSDIIRCAAHAHTRTHSNVVWMHAVWSATARCVYGLPIHTLLHCSTIVPALDEHLNICFPFLQFQSTTECRFDPNKNIINYRKMHLASSIRLCRQFCAFDARQVYVVNLSLHCIQTRRVWLGSEKIYQTFIQ